MEKQYTRHHEGRGIGMADGMTALVVDDKVQVGRGGVCSIVERGHRSSNEKQWKKM